MWAVVGVKVEVKRRENREVREKVHGYVCMFCISGQ